MTTAGASELGTDGRGGRTKTSLAIILGSTRPGRRGEAVARWALEAAARHPAVTAGETSIQLVDLIEFGLPLLDEPIPAIMGQYRNAHTVKWAETIASHDGFVFVTPEYNHSMTGALKNAIDYLYAEWNNKAAGFISYGVHGGTRAVEHLRLTLSELKVAHVRSQVALSLFSDFEIEDPMLTGRFVPAKRHEATLAEMLSEIIAWSVALAPLRASSTTTAQA